MLMSILLAFALQSAAPAPGDDNAFTLFDTQGGWTIGQALGRDECAATVDYESGRGFSIHVMPRDERAAIFYYDAKLPRLNDQASPRMRMIFMAKRDDPSTGREVVVTPYVRGDGRPGFFYGISAAEALAGLRAGGVLVFMDGKGWWGGANLTRGGAVVDSLARCADGVLKHHPLDPAKVA